jgi:hypothetical protein
MSLFVEVNSVEKNCPVIINLDHVVEIAPLASGGCALFTLDGAGMNSKNALRVSDSYDLFKQFAMQTVSAEDIARRFPKVEQKKPETANAEVKSPSKSKKSDDIQIPTLGG